MRTTTDIICFRTKINLKIGQKVSSFIIVTSLNLIFIKSFNLKFMKTLTFFSLNTHLHFGIRKNFFNPEKVH